MSRIKEFADESNMIEGLPVATKAELDALDRLVNLDEVEVDDLVRYVSVIQPNAMLRDNESVPCVRIGNYRHPSSGIDILDGLELLLGSAKNIDKSPYEIHQRYEHLHPFTDGNGRSGRALWAWMMIQRYGNLPDISFLHWWYYQSLSNWGER